MDDPEQLSKKCKVTLDDEDKTRVKRLGELAIRGNVTRKTYEVIENVKAVEAEMEKVNVPMSNRVSSLRQVSVNIERARVGADIFNRLESLYLELHDIREYADLVRHFSKDC